MIHNLDLNLDLDVDLDLALDLDFDFGQGSGHKVQRLICFQGLITYFKLLLHSSNCVKYKNFTLEWKRVKMGYLAILKP